MSTRRGTILPRAARRDEEGGSWPSTRCPSSRTTTAHSSRTTRREILELHHDKHHAAYVDGANATLEKLAAARAQTTTSSAINQLQKNLAFHVSGHVLHSLFWTNMSPDGGGEPDGELAAAIEEYFGSFDALRGQLTRGGAERAGLRLGRARLGAGRRSASSSSRSTTTRATSATAPCRCSCSTCGSTPTTCSTRT